MPAKIVLIMAYTHKSKAQYMGINFLYIVLL